MFVCWLSYQIRGRCISTRISKRGMTETQIVSLIQLLSLIWCWAGSCSEGFISGPSGGYEVLQNCRIVADTKDILREGMQIFWHWHSRHSIGSFRLWPCPGPPLRFCQPVNLVLGNHLIWVATWIGFDSFHSDSGNQVVVPSPHHLTWQLWNLSSDSWMLLIYLANPPQNYHPLTFVQCWSTISLKTK